MRIAIVTTIPIMLERFLRPVEAELRHRGHDTETWSGEDPTSGFKGLAGTGADRGFSWSRRPTAIGNLLALSKVRRAARTVDVLFLHSPVAAWLCRIALIGLRGRPKVVYLAHGLHFFKGQPTIRRLIFSALERVLAPYTDMLITINSEDLEASTRLGLASRIELAVNGVGVPLADFGRSIDAPPVRDGSSLVFVGELIPRKRVQWAIRALDHPALRGWTLTVVGDGPEREALEAEACRMGVRERVDFTGARSDVVEVLRRSTILAFPSSQEGLSRAVMEAIALGVPVVSSATRGVADLLERGGGLAALGGTEASFRATLARVCTSAELRHALAEEGQALRLQLDDKLAARRLADLIEAC